MSGPKIDHNAVNKFVESYSKDLEKLSDDDLRKYITEASDPKVAAQNRAAGETQESAAIRELFLQKAEKILDDRYRASGDAGQALSKMNNGGKEAREAALKAAHGYGIIGLLGDNLNKGKKGS